MIKVYDGIKFYGYIRDGEKEYYKNKEYGYLHVYKYQLETGLELDNMVVHHIDEDRHNNDLDNLVHMFKWCHHSMHSRNRICKPHTAETRNKISKSQAGHKVSAETKEKLRKAGTGRKVSAETKEKLRKAGTGRKVSAETRAKMSKSHTGTSKGMLC